MFEGRVYVTCCEYLITTERKYFTIYRRSVFTILRFPLKVKIWKYDTWNLTKQDTYKVWYSSYSRSLISLCFSGCRCAISWERAKPGQLTQTGQEGIPYPVTSCSAYKLQLARGQIVLIGSQQAIGVEESE